MHAAVLDGAEDDSLAFLFEAAEIVAFDPDVAVLVHENAFVVEVVVRGAAADRRIEFAQVVRV